MAHQDLSKADANLLKVKAHDVRALAASWAFHKGVAFEEIMEACHWRSHNTFTNFYLKDLTWTNDQDMSLGPFVAAQNIIS